jgi:hypothetical protein
MTDREMLWLALPFSFGVAWWCAGMDLLAERM